MYRYATLDPRPTADNTDVLAAPVGVYGIEVTIPALAAQCQLGNLDPQHSGGQPHIAACVAALSCPLPPDRATLATVRADADSVLAMAVLTLRADGKEGWDIGKVALIGQADSAPLGPWVPNYNPPAEFAQASAVAMNHSQPLEQRVAILTGWLTGEVQLPAAQPVDYSAVDVTLSPYGYAVARADGPAGRGAMAAGYRKAAVVVAANERFSFAGGPEHRKYTVARWNTSVDMDWDGMVAALQAAETGWGGSPSIVGSPQGVGSTLALEQVCAIVEKHLPA